MAGKKAKQAVKTVVKTVKNDPQLLAAVKNVGKRVDALAAKAAGEPKGPMQRLGRRLGGAVGAPGLGSLVGKGIGKITGTGDYHISVNSLIKPGSERLIARSSTASFGRSGDIIRVRKREMVGMVFSPGTANTFQSTSYRLNPGNPKLFPWLSSVMAAGYEQWRPMGVVLSLISVASEYATGGTLGSYGIAIDYQGLDPIYSSKTQAENSDGAVSCKVSDDLMMGVECDPAKRPYNVLYVRQTNSNVTTSSSAINTFDLGNIQVFVQGVPTANLALAELWIEYDLEFEKQQLIAGPLGGGCFTYMLSSSTFSNASPFSNVASNMTQFGDMFLPIVVNGGNINAQTGGIGTAASGPGFSIQFPPWLTGVFSLLFYWAGSGTAIIAPPTFAYGSNTTLLSAFGSNSSAVPGAPNVIAPPITAPKSGETGSQLMVLLIVNCAPLNTGSDSNSVTILATPTLPASGNQADLIIQQIALSPVSNTVAVGNPSLPAVNGSPW